MDGEYIANNILCIDAFIEHGVVDVGVFSRDLFFKDMNTCNVTISDTEHFFIMNKKVVFSVEKEHGFVARVVTRFL